MDWSSLTGLGYLLTGIAAIGGVLWTIYSARQKDKRSEAATLMRDARDIITSYKEKTEQQEEEISGLRREIEWLKRRYNRLEARYQRVLKLLPEAALRTLAQDEDEEPHAARP